MNNQPQFILGNIWTEPGDNAKFPKATTVSSSTNYYYFNNSLASFYTGSYIRLGSVSFSYNIPQNILSKIKFSSIQLYLMGNNLFTITKNPGLDPETKMGMPNLRIFTFGIRTNF